MAALVRSAGIALERVRRRRAAWPQISWWKGSKVQIKEGGGPYSKDGKPGSAGEETLEVKSTVPSVNEGEMHVKRRVSGAYGPEFRLVKAEGSSRTQWLPTKEIA